MSVLLYLPESFANSHPHVVRGSKLPNIIRGLWARLGKRVTRACKRNGRKHKLLCQQSFSQTFAMPQIQFAPKWAIDLARVFGIFLSPF